jgi:DNA primase
MSDVVQEIKDKLNIIDVIQPYVELHKAGKNFKGKSPFSTEKTPSFYVSPDRGMYYCFSTSQGGDIFNFIQAMEGVDFKEALKLLAEKAGVELRPENPEKRGERDRLYEVLEAATAFYQEQLPRELEAMAYLERRGVKQETIAKWRIGYAPGPPSGGWREVKDYLEGKRFVSEELYKAGLIKKTDGGKEPFDVFRDRVMFPIAEPGGKVVAFSGRILHLNDKAPKYVNSPETELYKKSDILFGYDKAKHGIRNLKFSLIVEGQFDVVMCHQAGYGNTVAVSGTALTLHHVQLLERLSEKVVLALDADRAGIAAMKKAADVMLRRGLDVKVAEMPLGMDPADMILEDPHRFKHTIGQSVHVIEFLLHVLRREIADDRSFKLKVRDEVLSFILLLPNRIDQEHFVEKVAVAIGSTLDAVRFELERLRDKAKEASSVPRPAVQSEGIVAQAAASPSMQLEQHYLFLLAAVAVIATPLKEMVAHAIRELPKEGELAMPNESELAGTTFKLEQQFAELPQLAVDDEVLVRLNHFRIGLLRRRLAGLRAKLSAPEGSSDDAVLTAILADISVTERELRQPPYTLDEAGGQKH